MFLIDDSIEVAEGKPNGGAACPRTKFKTDEPRDHVTRRRAWLSSVAGACAHPHPLGRFGFVQGRKRKCNGENFSLSFTSHNSNIDRI